MTGAVRLSYVSCVCIVTFHVSQRHPIWEENTFNPASLSSCVERENRHMV